MDTHNTDSTDLAVLENDVKYIKEAIDKLNSRLDKTLDKHEIRISQALRNSWMAITAAIVSLGIKAVEYLKLFL